MQDVAHILYGSQNQQYDLPTSDKDYKIIWVPSFSDLYYSRNGNKHTLGAQYDKEHYTGLDIRNWCDLLIKGNPNAIELLFSSEIDIYNSSFIPWLRTAQSVYQTGYIYEVWDTFISACKGIAKSCFERGTLDKANARQEFWYLFIQKVKQNNFIVNDESFLVGERPRQVRLGLVEPTQFDWDELRDIPPYLTNGGAKEELVFSTIDFVKDNMF